MEAAETLKPAPKPDFSFNNDPAWFLGSVNYLDPEDPIDQLLADYKTEIEHDTLSTAAQQRALIKGLQNGELDSARTLIEAHQGLVAAVAYPFKPSESSRDDLLRTGTHALVQAAKSYDMEGPDDFSDHAARAIHTALSDIAPGLAGDSFIELPQLPMEGVYQFMEAVRVGGNRREIKNTSQRLGAREEIRQDGEKQEILRHIVYMRDQDVAELPGIDRSEQSIAQFVSKTMKRMGLPYRNRTALILELHRQGMEFDVPEPKEPIGEALYAHEIEIASRLHLPYEEIMELESIKEFLGPNLRIERIGEIVYQARQKVGARTRQELALMAEIFHDESDALEVSHSNNEWKLAKHLGLTSLEGYNIEDLLSVTTDRQRRAIEAYHLAEEVTTWPEVGKALGVKGQAAQLLAQRAIKRMAKKLEELESEEPLSQRGLNLAH